MKAEEARALRKANRERADQLIYAECVALIESSATAGETGCSFPSPNGEDKGLIEDIAELGYRCNYVKNGANYTLEIYWG